MARSARLGATTAVFILFMNILEKLKVLGEEKNRCHSNIGAVYMYIIKITDRQMFGMEPAAPVFPSRSRLERHNDSGSGFWSAKINYTYNCQVN